MDGFSLCFEAKSALALPIRGNAEIGHPISRVLRHFIGIGRSWIAVGENRKRAYDGLAKAGLEFRIGAGSSPQPTVRALSPPRSRSASQDCADYNGEELKRRVDLLNDLLVLIRRCRIKAALKTSRDNGFELRVRHTLRGNWGGGLELSRYQRCN